MARDGSLRITYVSKDKNVLGELEELITSGGIATRLQNILGDSGFNSIEFNLNRVEPISEEGFTQAKEFLCTVNGKHRTSLLSNKAWSTNLSIRTLESKKHDVIVTNANSKPSHSDQAHLVNNALHREIQRIVRVKGLEPWDEYESISTP